MKNPEPIRKARYSQGRTMPGRFEHHSSAAKAGSGEGSFNSWQPDGCAMTTDGGSRCEYEFWMPAGTYEPPLLVGGHWLADLLATGTELNPYEGLNSILKVGGGEANGPIPDEFHTPKQ